MGLVGLFVGPVLMALLVAIWREWLLTTESAVAPEVELEPVPFDDPASTEGVVASAVIVPQKTTAWSAKAQEASGS